MNGQGEPLKRTYRGIWAILANVFKVPQEPPTLIAAAADRVESFRPARGFLAYLKLQFWIVLLLVDAGLLLLWIVLFVKAPLAGVLLAPVFLVVMFLPDLLAYVALQLRYDTTWYVMSDRSLRIRRGIWLLRETTITFENVQNVELKQGPLQRHFGISNLIVQTAGGSGVPTEPGQTNPHLGLIEGVDNAERIRERIMTRVRKSRRAGLGDEHPDERRPVGGGAGWTPAHLDALRDIREVIVGLRSQRGQAGTAS